MFGTKRGRLTAIIINLLGTLFTIDSLLRFDNVLYALLIILFALSVSATQCRRRLIITVPVLVINLCVVCLGIPVSLYQFYAAYGSTVSDISMLAEPASLVIYSMICLLNALIIRNLHFAKPSNGNANAC
jgi:hypothetical protein